ncbi:MAG: hypothetical protein AAGM27_05315 [Cyanobacteria bacterium J06554_3]
MQTRFVELEVPLVAGDRTGKHMGNHKIAPLRPQALRSHIESQLTAHGIPLRWAITHINSQTKMAHVEAVVTTMS